MSYPLTALQLFVITTGTSGICVDMSSFARLPRVRSQFNLLLLLSLCYKTPKDADAWRRQWRAWQYTATQRNATAI